VKLMLDNLPPSLTDQRETLTQCLRAMDQAAPLRSVYLFGSHARGEAKPDSDVDLCLVADSAERQQEILARLGNAIWDVWPRPPLTLIPISPQRLAEKKAVGDHFFQTVLQEGVLLAEED
jgi:predicted nucleotidyltransferase